MKRAGRPERTELKKKAMGEEEEGDKAVPVISLCLLSARREARESGEREEERRKMEREKGS